ncbi:UDP-N-acetylmuramate/alanine ligase [Gloeothece citriformis PCC 7424]|uniref:UDP-N-acetylmuramate--L-alanine ligase n=1 Tax=Gloeothece citriformis (strain PCC 7424) TaxID=65393 RepID=MURC_GLOC7|nr:UDP-N-acetylmuramate--L-alanine ligase [Gloeothece citriformis]B7KHE9.1 RecName: Full=UDP-N-acetylmuramate--L-alanine ligase; AltName: Full=UDP-N-acetylmuramoyl-L-alanine synthetase [Gloeothece citriformis PCC 7424]ACK70644.1 UDP-N-acetylmuramate/alanine ligase [Gloeothece citriformis PCC 7424]
MVKTVDFNGRPFHFIGIGGIGMSGLAYILAKRHLPVSGSDVRSSHITQRLQSVGAKVFNTQEATNLTIFQPTPEDSLTTLIPCASGESKKVEKTHQADSALSPNSLPQIICSTAIADNNSEYQAAKELGYPIFHRSDVLAALIKDYYSIGVAGTHGKTTTSSLIGYMLLGGGLDPTIIVGGEVDAWDGNARLGQGQFLVAEVDESDGSLTKHSPRIGIITNIELDHPDHYQTLDEVVKTFQIFEQQCETLIACIDCKTVRTHFKPQITYSLDPDREADYTVKNVTYKTDGSMAEVWEKGQYLGQMHISLLGQHNISNALAAVAVGRTLGLDFEVIASGIATFIGAKRRFEHKGYSQGITFIDDYAHHPSEVRCTLEAARLRLDQDRYRRVVAIFQPHRYSRTATFMDEFATSFDDADVVIVTDIYSAGEVNIGQISGQQVADAISRHHQQVFYHPSLKSLGSFLSQILEPGDLALFLGAGNLNQIIPELISPKVA